MKAPWFHIVCELDCGQKPAPMIRDIQRAVCGRFAGVSLNDVLSPRRMPEIIMPRQIAMYLARSLTTKSFPTIAAAFGDRDHTTIIYGVRKIDRLIRQDDGLKQMVASISNELGCAA
jgi:chromosomal replication initiator protein